MFTSKELADERSFFNCFSLFCHVYLYKLVSPALYTQIGYLPNYNSDSSEIDFHNERHPSI